MSSWGTAFGSATVSAMRVYEDVLAPRLFVPWARLLLERLQPQPGEAVLDVACGPGTVATLAAELVGRNGRVVGCDLSPAMLEIARAKPALAEAAPIEYREAPADRLPIAEAEFDVGVCQQGLQFFPDRRAALAELHRALRPDGRLGIAVWTVIEDSPPFAVIYDAIRDVAGSELAERYRDGPWGFPDARELRAVAESAGFRDVKVERYAVDVTFEGSAPQLLSTLAASGIAADIDALPATQKLELARALDRRAGPLMADGSIRSVTSSNLTVARR